MTHSVHFEEETNFKVPAHTHILILIWKPHEPVCLPDSRQFMASRSTACQELIFAKKIPPELTHLTWSWNFRLISKFKGQNSSRNVNEHIKTNKSEASLECTLDSFIKSSADLYGRVKLIVPQIRRIYKQHNNDIKPHVPPCSEVQFKAARFQLSTFNSFVHENESRCQVPGVTFSTKPCTREYNSGQA